jgi:hypothetical protein
MSESELSAVIIHSDPESKSPCSGSISAGVVKSSKFDVLFDCKSSKISPVAVEITNLCTRTIIIHMKHVFEDSSSKEYDLDLVKDGVAVEIFPYQFQISAEDISAALFNRNDLQTANYSLDDKIIALKSDTVKIELHPRYKS